MFPPQPTPYTPFSSYGVGSTIPDFAGFQSTGLGVDSGGPTVFRDPIFSPAASDPIPFDNHLPQRFKMSGHDMEAQEAAAREFQPSLEVWKIGIGTARQLLIDNRAPWLIRRRAVMLSPKSMRRQIRYTSPRQPYVIRHCRSPSKLMFGRLYRRIILIIDQFLETETVDGGVGLYELQPHTFPSHQHRSCSACSSYGSLRGLTAN